MLTFLELQAEASYPLRNWSNYFIEGQTDIHIKYIIFTNSLLYSLNFLSHLYLDCSPLYSSCCSDILNSNHVRVCNQTDRIRGRHGVDNEVGDLAIYASNCRKPKSDGDNVAHIGLTTRW